MYKSRFSRKTDSHRLFSREYDFPKTFSLTKNQFSGKTYFYTNCLQAAALEGLARLKSMNVPTKRPEDYFAQMAKTDEHMQKVMFKIESLKAFRGQRGMIIFIIEVTNFKSEVKFDLRGCDFGG